MTLDIKRVSINWRLGWLNSPELNFELAGVAPFPDNYLYTAYPVPRSKQTMYIGYHRDTDTYSYMVHNPSDERGFAGRHFHLRMAHGETVIVKGPWASRASAASLFLPEPIMDVNLSITGTLSSVQRAMKVSRVRQILDSRIGLQESDPLLFVVPKRTLAPGDAGEVEYVVSVSPTELQKPPPSDKV